MTPQDETELQINLAQYRLAKWLQTLSLLFGLAGATRYGLPSLIMGLLGVWLFHLAKPGPNERLDRISGRNKPG